MDNPLIAFRMSVALVAKYTRTPAPGNITARRLAERLDIHYTPKHGSWLNMAEIELSVLKGQCLDRRIPNMATMQTQVATWEKERNNNSKNIVWQFTTSDA